MTYVDALSPSTVDQLTSEEVKTGMCCITCFSTGLKHGGATQTTMPLGTTHDLKLHRGPLNGVGLN